MAFDGKGPAVGWFPRFLRPWVNRFFARMGWPEPYDLNLNKIPRDQRRPCPPSRRIRSPIAALLGYRYPACGRA